MIKNFGDLQEGDVIESVGGQPVTVLKAYDVHVPERMFEIESEDGQILQLSGNHLMYVELQTDKELHKQRVREFKKLFKFSDEKVEFLKGMAESDKEIDTTLHDYIKLCEARTPQQINAIVRVAESVGHIAEDNYTYQDMSDENVVMDGPTVKVYDARRMSQQVLALSNRKFAKQYKIIVGRVMQMQDVAELTIPFELPDA